MKPPHVREIDVTGFRRRLGAFLDVYAAAMSPPDDQLPGRHSIMYRHSTYPDFRAIVAETPRRFPRREPTVAGFIYGFHGAPGQWWHDVVYNAVRERSGAEEAEKWLADPFEVAELHVRPEYQGHGLGRKLLNGLCQDREEHTVVLSTLDRPATRAKRLYGSVGMTDLLSDFEFPGGGPHYAVMGAALPVR